QEQGRRAARSAVPDVLVEHCTRMDRVKQKLEALKARKLTRRTSYLNGRRPRGAKFFPRDTTLWANCSFRPSTPSDSCKTPSTTDMPSNRNCQLESASDGR
ncbi:unnamed protein product, partial [Discosporangium mesarthrocarpum]